MGRENRKEAVASLHREQMLRAAERLFWQKGYGQTTIDDISRESGYSRRTLYAYYQNKEDILHHILIRGLEELKNGLTAAAREDSFVRRFRGVFAAMRRYQEQYPFSSEAVNRADTAALGGVALSDAVREIFRLGEEINGLLAGLIEQGQREGAVRRELVPGMTVAVLWPQISALLTLVQTKGKFLSAQFGVTGEELLNYGLNQILRSILAVRD